MPLVPRMGVSQRPRPRYSQQDMGLARVRILRLIFPHMVTTGTRVLGLRQTHRLNSISLHRTDTSPHNLIQLSNSLKPAFQLK